MVIFIFDLRVLRDLRGGELYMEHSDEFESAVDSFPIKLENFEGPLDLLLHLIRKNQVSIEDIPIALITAQYLDAIAFIRKHQHTETSPS